MRKQLLFLFICFVTIPIIIVYSVATAIFNNRTDENLKNIYSNDLKNITSIAENYFSESIELTMYPLLENNLYRFFTASSEDSNFSDIADQASTVLNSSPYVFGGLRGVVMYRTDGKQIATHSGYISNDYITDYQRSMADQLNGKCFWEYEENASTSLFSITRLIKSKTNLLLPLGYIQTSISCKELQNKIKNAIIEKNSVYFIMDDSNQILLSTSNTKFDADTLNNYDFDTLSKLASKRICTVLDNHYFISAQKIDNTPYLMGSVITSDVYTATRSTLLNVLTIAAIITTFFFILLALIFSNRIVRPIQELSRSMDSISNENFSVRASIRGHDEIAMLAARFNKMGERLEYLYRQVYMKELELKQAQLLALQSQINPHFLYNTMDTIYWMSKTGNTTDIERIVSNMSQLLRLTFTPDTSNTTTLENEINHLNHYMEIQKIRYGDSVTFELQYQEGFQNQRVLRFLLQPLVENALTHGLKDRPNERIIVKIYRQERHLFYRIMNTGTPLDLEMISHLLDSPNAEKKGFAIKNINRRLKLKYGEEYGLLYWIEDDFNIFEIRQPIFSDEPTLTTTQ